MTGSAWQVLPPDDPGDGRYEVDGYAVVTAEWSPDADRAEHYVATRMSRETAELLVAAHAGRVSPETP